MSEKSLSIIIVNWNGMNFLPDCLKSIAKNLLSLDYEVVIVDNVSTDKSREWLSSEEASKFFKNNNLRVILSDKNLGFGRANNLAIEKTSSPYVFILNPDTIVKNKAIDCLIETLEADEKIGAVSPKLLNDDETLQESVASYPPNPIKILLQGFRLTRILPKSLRQKYFYGEDWSHDEKRAVPVFWGTAIMAKRSMIEQVGAFDPDFFMYGEDVEWCVRINKKGWKTVFVPEAEIIHLGGKSSEQVWEKSETSLRKDEADILVQKKSLPQFLVAFNSLTKGFVYSAAYLRRFLLGEKRDFLKKHISLQLSTSASAFASTINLRKGNRNDKTVS